MLSDWTVRGHGSLARRLASGLRSAIHHGQLPAGIALPPERHLAAALAVGRTTLVAALDELRAEGLVVSRQGSGTVVLDRSPAVTAAVASGAGRASLVDRASSGRDTINLAVSAPADGRDLPPLRLDTADLLSVVPADGYHPLGLPAVRAAIAEHHRAAGLPTGAGEVHVTNGGQHAIDIALATLVRRGATVLVEEPTYPGALDVIARHGARAVPLLGDDLARAVREAAAGGRRPAAVYLQPGVHNPTGRVLPATARKHLARALDELDVPVVEDNCLADLCFTGARLPSLAALCERAPVLSVESITKVAWGGLRAGWLRGPRHLIEATARQRHAVDFGSPVAAQLLTVQVLAAFDDVVQRRRRRLAAAADRFARAVEAQLAGCRFERPAGGLSMWLDLGDIDGTAFASAAVRHGVAVVAGAAASPSGRGDNHIRICFDRPPGQLDEAVARLAAAWDSVRPGGGAVRAVG